MADKGRRAAARQGQLSRRRKKGQRGPSGIPQIQHPGGPAAFGASTGSMAETRDAAAAAAAAESDADSATATATATAAPAATPRRTGAAPARAPSASPAPSGNGATAAAPAPAPRGQAAPRSGRARNERPPAYNYVGAELRRIGVLSLSVVAALVVLGIVL